MELGRALDVGEGVLGYIVEVELMGLWRLDLAFKRVQTICELFDVACSGSAYHVVSCKKREYAPFTWPTLHRLSAELTSCSGPLATRAGLWPIFAGCIASNLS